MPGLIRRADPFCCRFKGYTDRAVGSTPQRAPAPASEAFDEQESDSFPHLTLYPASSRMEPARRCICQSTGVLLNGLRVISRRASLRRAALAKQNYRLTKQIAPAVWNCSTLERVSRKLADRLVTAKASSFAALFRVLPCSEFHADRPATRLRTMHKTNGKHHHSDSLPAAGTVPEMSWEDDPLWYKDAIIYGAHPALRTAAAMASAISKDSPRSRLHPGSGRQHAVAASLLSVADA